MSQRSNYTKYCFSMSGVFLSLSLAGCDDGSYQSYADRYDKNILKIDRLDEECQIVEGPGRGNKFYINIIGDSFVRSSIVPLSTVSPRDYPEIAEGPFDRKTVHLAAHQVAEILEARDKKAAAAGKKRAVMPFADYRADRIVNYGVDTNGYCLSYKIYNTKDGESPDITCTYLYSPKERTLTKSYPELFDPVTDMPIPHDMPQNGVIKRDIGKIWSGEWVAEKSICRPTDVKLR